MKIGILNNDLRFGDPRSVALYFPLHQAMALEAWRHDAHLTWFDSSTPVAPFFAKKRDLEFDGLIGIVPWRTNQLWDRPSSAGSKPFVNLLIQAPFPKSNFVGNDDAASVEIAVRHLLSGQHRRIGLFCVGIESYAFEIYDAFCKSIQACGLPLKKEWVFGDFDYASHARKAKVDERDLFQSFRPSTQIEQDLIFQRIIEASERPDAVIFSNSYYANRFLEFMAARDLRAPGDIAVISLGAYHTYFDNRENVPLSVVVDDRAEIGKMGVILLCDMIAGRRPTHSQKILIPPELKISGSSLKSAAAEPEEYRIKTAIVDFIAAHYAEKNILVRLAGFLGMDYKYFSKKFKT
ncbi:MAG: substrate-binding domain-containing protein, partial [Spirochaetia bacterium]|nr:substrate-binding domain-containing protein [Spirochaetia bacterium]